MADSVPYRHALYHACLGDAFDAKEATRIGIINYAVPVDQLEADVDKLRARLLKKSPAILRATKQAMRQVRTMTFDQAYDYLLAKKMWLYGCMTPRIHTGPGCPNSSTKRHISRPMNHSRWAPCLPTAEASKHGCMTASGKRLSS